MVQGFQQGPLAGAAAPGFEDLQVPQGGLIQAQKVVPAKGQQAVQVGEVRGVGILQIPEDGPGGGHPQEVGVQPEAVQKKGAQGAAHFLPGRLGIEGIGRHPPLGGRGVEGDQGRGQEGRVQVVRDHQLGGFEPPEFIGQGIGALAFGEAEFPGGQLQKSQAPPGPLKSHRRQVVVGAGVQGGGVHHGAPGEDAGHFPAHQAFGLGRVLGLVAHHHLEPLLQEAGDVAGGRMDGKAGHGDALVPLAGAGGEGDIQGVGGDLGVAEEGLVKIAHLEEHQGIGVLLLQVQVLPQHGGDFVRRGAGHGAYGNSSGGPKIPKGSTALPGNRGAPGLLGLGGNLGFGDRGRGLSGGAGLFQFLGQDLQIVPELADGLALLIVLVDAV